MEKYCIFQCANWISEHKFEKVALQFPDELLLDAAAVATSLYNELGFTVFILGDTTFGNCCVDEVAAEHVGAHAIIHFGRTCLSPSQRLPVLYVLGPLVPVDIRSVLDRLKGDDGPHKDRDLVFVYDTSCFHAVDELSSLLIEAFSNICISHLVGSKKSSFINPNSSSIYSQEIGFESHDIDEHVDLKEEHFNGRKIHMPVDKRIEDYDFIYLGPDSPSLIALRMRFSDRTFYHVEGEGQTLIVGNSIKRVMSRSKKIEQIKEANIIGILVGTLGIEKYQEIINKLKKLIKKSGKRFYTFAIGKHNEPKLANIVGVDVFVYVACPENSLFDRIENAYLYKYLVTPWELQVGLNPSQEWSLNFEMNFKEFLSGGRLYKVDEENKKGEDNLEEKEQQREDSSKALMTKPEGHLYQLHQDGAGAVLRSLNWQGLNPDEPPPNELGTVVQGRKGIASQYEDETQ